MVAVLTGFHCSIQKTSLISRVVECCLSSGESTLGRNDHNSSESLSSLFRAILILQLKRQPAKNCFTVYADSSRINGFILCHRYIDSIHCDPPKLVADVASKGPTI